jgi:ferrous iron transport protein B
MPADRPLRILVLAAECTPFVKTGGLADVIGALPKAIADLGHDVRVAMPRYGRIDRDALGLETILEPFGVPMDGQMEDAAKSQQKIIRLHGEMEAEQQANSLIGRLGETVEPVIRPLGFDWKMGISLLTGFAAKEIVVSTMAVLYQANEADPTTSLQTRISEEVYSAGPKEGEPVFTPLAGISFLLFVLFYLPCIAVIAAVGRESGSWKWAAFVLFYTTSLAWLVSFAVYQVGSMLQIG